MSSSLIPSSSSLSSLLYLSLFRFMRERRPDRQRRRRAMDGAATADRAATAYSGDQTTPQTLARFGTRRRSSPSPRCRSRRRRCARGASPPSRSRRMEMAAAAASCRSPHSTRTGSRCCPSTTSSSSRPRRRRHHHRSKTSSARSGTPSTPEHRHAIAADGGKKQLVVGRRELRARAALRCARAAAVCPTCRWCAAARFGWPSPAPPSGPRAALCL